MVRALNQGGFMPLPTTHSPGESLEECLDELNELLQKLDHYAPDILALALRAHLTALLQAMRQNALCSRDEVQRFMAESARQALGD
jgi:hypothetical protein